MVHGSIFNFFLILICACTSIEAAKHERIHEIISPYLMPDDHPIKDDLDTLFGNYRATFNLDTLKKAGFDKAFPRKFTRLIVTRHPRFAGYIFKIYLDVQRYHSDKSEYTQWIARVKGAEAIREYIQHTGTEHLFKVPHAWIYALPAKPKCPEGYMPKDYILIEEDMDLISSEENKLLWASDEIEPSLLDAVFALVGEIGLDDCLKPDNLPFGEDGRIAFIDTESYGKKVKYKHLTSFLSEQNQEYWKQLIKNHQ